MKRPIIYVDGGKHPQEIQELMENTTHCLTCGADLSELPNKQSRRNRGYCNMKHYLEKPPKMAYIEIKYKLPIRDVLLKVLSEELTVTLAAKRLGISKGIMYKWIHKSGIWG